MDSTAYPSLAFTALLELYPHFGAKMPERGGGPLVAELVQAMKDARSRGWVPEYRDPDLDDVRAFAADWITFKLAEQVYVITRGMTEDAVGRPCTAGELLRVANALPHSTIPEALSAVVNGMGLGPAEDGD